MSQREKYEYTRALPCPQCLSGSFRLLARNQPGECLAEVQCRECSFKVHAIHEHLFGACLDALVIWNEQKRKQVAA